VTCWKATLLTRKANVDIGLKEKVEIIANGIQKVVLARLGDEEEERKELKMYIFLWPVSMFHIHF
jgi:hypothetical protein